MEHRTGSSNEDPRRKMQQDKEQLKQQGLDQARSKAETGKAQAADQLESLSEAVDQAASSLSEQDKDGLANYVHQASEQMSSLAQRLQSRSVDELAADTKRLAREKPAAFLVGSIALGFGLSRFLKASRQGQEQGRSQGQGIGRSGTSDLSTSSSYPRGEGQTGTSGYRSPASPSSPSSPTSTGSTGLGNGSANPRHHYALTRNKKAPPARAGGAFSCPLWLSPGPAGR